MSEDKRAGWTVSGSHVVLPLAMVQEIQQVLDILEDARLHGNEMAERSALHILGRLINDEIGQPATRAAG